MNNLGNSERHKKYTQEGFGAFEIDQVSANKYAIRGREQQLIDHYGGAQSVGGTARNQINSIGDYNPRGRVYYKLSNKTFGGELPDNSPSRFRIWK